MYKKIVDNGHTIANHTYSHLIFDLSEVNKRIDKSIKYNKCKGKYVSKDGIELVYDVRFKNKVNDSIINDLAKISGVDTINIVASNTDTMG